MPSRTQIESLFRWNITRSCTFNRSIGLITSQLHKSTYRDRAHAIVRVTPVDSEQARTYAENGISFHTYSKQLRNDEMSELMNVNCKAENKDEGQDIY